MSAPLIGSRWIHPLLRRHISCPKRSYVTDATSSKFNLSDWYRRSIVGHTIVGGLVGSVYFPVFLWERIYGDIRKSKSTVSNTEFFLTSLLWAPAGSFRWCQHWIFHRPHCTDFLFSSGNLLVVSRQEINTNLTRVIHSSKTIIKLIFSYLIDKNKLLLLVVSHDV